MVYVHADEKTRVYLSKEIIEQYGRDFILVPAKNELIFIPVPKDPLKVLKEEGKKIPKHITTQELKHLIADEIEKEILARAKKG